MNTRKNKNRCYWEYFWISHKKKKKKRPPYVHTMGHCSHLSLQLPTWHWLISWKKNPQDREPNRYIFANNQGLVCLWYQILAYRKLPTAQFVHYFLNTRGLKLCMPLFHSWILNWSCCATLPQLCYPSPAEAASPASLGNQQSYSRLLQNLSLKKMSVSRQFQAQWLQQCLRSLLP